MRTRLASLVTFALWSEVGLLFTKSELVPVCMWDRKNMTWLVLAGSFSCHYIDSLAAVAKPCCLAGGTYMLYGCGPHNDLLWSMFLEVVHTVCVVASKP